MVVVSLSFCLSRALPYYYLAGQLLEPVRTAVDNAVLSFESGNASVVDSYECIESISSSVVSVLQSAASTFVPSTARVFLNSGGMTR